MSQLEACLVNCSRYVSILGSYSIDHALHS
jgi:hypothetical protein